MDYKIVSMAGKPELPLFQQEFGKNAAGMVMLPKPHAPEGEDSIAVSLTPGSEIFAVADGVGGAQSAGSKLLADACVDALGSVFDHKYQDLFTLHRQERASDYAIGIHNSVTGFIFREVIKTLLQFVATKGPRVLGSASIAFAFGVRLENRMYLFSFGDCGFLAIEHEPTGQVKHVRVASKDQYYPKPFDTIDQDRKSLGFVHALNFAPLQISTNDLFALYQLLKTPRSDGQRHDVDDVINAFFGNHLAEMDPETKNYGNFSRSLEITGPVSIIFGSDGLWDNVNREFVLETVSKTTDPKKVVDALLTEAQRQASFNDTTPFYREYKERYQDFARRSKELGSHYPDELSVLNKKPDDISVGVVQLRPIGEYPVFSDQPMAVAPACAATDRNQPMANAFKRLLTVLARGDQPMDERHTNWSELVTWKAELLTELTTFNRAFETFLAAETPHRWQGDSCVLIPHFKVRKEAWMAARLQENTDMAQRLLRAKSVLSLAIDYGLLIVIDRLFPSHILQQYKVDGPPAKRARLNGPEYTAMDLFATE